MYALSLRLRRWAAPASLLLQFTMLTGCAVIETTASVAKTTVSVAATTVETTASVAKTGAELGMKAASTTATVASASVAAGAAARTATAASITAGVAVVSAVGSFVKWGIEFSRENQRESAPLTSRANNEFVSREGVLVKTQACESANVGDTAQLVRENEHAYHVNLETAVKSHTASRCEVVAIEPSKG